MLFYAVYNYFTKTKIFDSEAYNNISSYNFNIEYSNKINIERIPISIRLIGNYIKKYSIKICASKIKIIGIGSILIPKTF